MTVDRGIIDLHNEYVHTALPRREFLARLTQVAGGGAAATLALAVLEPNYAQARQVDPRTSGSRPGRSSSTVRRARSRPRPRAARCGGRRGLLLWAPDAQGVPYSLNMYPGTQHGFHNDASTARYEPAARLAWNRTLDFFDTYLK